MKTKPRVTWTLQKLGGFRCSGWVSTSAPIVVPIVVTEIIHQWICEFYSRDNNYWNEIKLRTWNIIYGIDQLYIYWLARSRSTKYTMVHEQIVFIFIVVINFILSQRLIFHFSLFSISAFRQPFLIPKIRDHIPSFRLNLSVVLYFLLKLFVLNAVSCS